MTTLRSFLIASAFMEGSGSFTNDIDMDFKTSHGVDKLHLMIKVIAVINGQNAKIEKNLIKLKSFLVQQLKRGLTLKEDIALSEAILGYIKTDPGTNERIEAMDNLFGLKFLEI